MRCVIELSVLDSCVAYRTLINFQALFNYPEFEAARYPIQGGLARLRGERFRESSEFSSDIRMTHTIPRHQSLFDTIAHGLADCFAEVILIVVLATASLIEHIAH
jgi:hypothetical protein